nr:hypothetical protein [Tanacetum cinerariifolium]
MEYIRLEEEKARRHGQTFDWQTATFRNVKHYDDEDDCSIDFNTEFPAIVFDNTIILFEPNVCPPNERKLDFKISLDEFDDEDYTRLKTIWSRPVNRVYVLDFAGLTLEMRHDLVVRLRIIYSREGHQAPKKVTSIDLFYLRSMDHGTIDDPPLLGLVSDEGLRGLQVVTRELPLIDLHELERLHICTRYGDTWAWVAQGPERQQAATTSAHEDNKAGPAAEETHIRRIEPLGIRRLHTA